MKFLFDLLPVILFFAAYKIAGGHPEASQALANAWLGSSIDTAQAPILIATAVAIISTFCQVAVLWLMKKKVEKALWFSLAIIVVLGGATLYFNNPTFIKWKPTALYWLFAGILMVASGFFGKNLIRRMLESQIKLPPPVWSHLNRAWIVFFALMGILNLYVAYGFSEQAWVNFKLFGGMGLMLAFVLGQGFYLSRYMEEDSGS